MIFQLPALIYALAVIFQPANEALAKINMVLPAKNITPVQIWMVRNFPWSFVMKAPPMGLLTSAAIESTANSLPMRIPISLISEICAIIAGSRETKDPDPNPYNAAKMIKGTLPLAGSHRASTMILEKKHKIICVLYRPTRSLIQPGRIRPNKLRLSAGAHHKDRGISTSQRSGLGLCMMQGM